MIYAFDEDVAKVVGVEAAVVLDKFAWWIRKNEANGKNFHEGRYWTYNSTKAMEDLFPFFNRWKIERILKKLIKDGYLLTGNFNKMAFDRTLWYALSDKGNELVHIANHDLADLQNDISQIHKMSFSENATPIPLPTNNTPSLKIYSSMSPPKKPKKKFVPPSYEEVKAYIDEKRLNVDAQKFFDYYEAGDWHDGKGNAVKNWKQKCLTWDKHTDSKPVTATCKTRTSNVVADPMEYKRQQEALEAQARAELFGTMGCSQ